MSTTAIVRINNQLTGELTLLNDKTQNKNIENYEQFNNVLVAPGTTFVSSASKPVSTTPGEQSFFNIHFRTKDIAGMLQMDLGTWPYNTKVLQNTDAVHLGALLAPTDGKFDYTFYLFAGNGLLTDVVNSILQANYEAVVKAYVASNPEYPIKDLTSVKIRSAAFSNLACTYASVTRRSESSMFFTVIIKADQIDIGYKAGEALPDIIHVHEPQILLQGIIDLTSVASPEITVDLVKCYIAAYEMPYYFQVALFAALFVYINETPTGPTLAAILNGTSKYGEQPNLDIIDNLNKAIAAALKNMSFTPNR